MNYWKILESMNGLPTENMWNALWGNGGGSGEIEYVGTVPFSVIAKGGNASEWSLYGAGPFQEWTPSPEKERTANLLDVKEIYPPNAFTYSGEEITAINTAFAQTRINLSSYIGKALTFSAEIKKESGITRAYLRANIGGEIIDSADILKNSEYTYFSVFSIYHLFYSSFGENLGHTDMYASASPLRFLQNSSRRLFQIQLCP